MLLEEPNDPAAIMHSLHVETSFKKVEVEEQNDASLGFFWAETYTASVFPMSAIACGRYRRETDCNSHSTPEVQHHVPVSLAPGSDGGDACYYCALQENAMTVGRDS